jgi:hypothetical protein
MTREVLSVDIFADRRRANPSKVDRYERVFRRQSQGAWQAQAAPEPLVTLLPGQDERQARVTRFKRWIF